MNTKNLIPISYVKQFTPLVVGDELFIITSRREFKINCLNQLAVFNTNKNGSDCYDPSNYYLVSFADRPNTTGKQPVDDDVVVDVVYSLNKVHTVKAEIAGWLSEEIDTHSATRNWKPNHEAMLAKFKEQGANTMNTRQYDDQETELATHYSGNNNRFYSKCYGANRKAMILNDVGRWIRSDCTTNAELDSDEFWKLDGNQIDSPTLPDENVGQKMIRVICEFNENSESAVDKPVLSEDWVIDHLTDKPVGDGVNDDTESLQRHLDKYGATPDKPVFTQEMADDFKIPKVGSDVEIFDAPSGSYVKCEIICHHKKALFIAVDGWDAAVSVADDSLFRPIDNRSDEERLRDAVWESTELRARDGAAGVVSRLLSSDKFTITLNKE